MFFLKDSSQVEVADPNNPTKKIITTDKCIRLYPGQVKKYNLYPYTICLIFLRDEKF
jgi:hypothetical protein